LGQQAKQLEIEAAGAVFRLAPAIAAAYGPLDGYDLGTVEGLLRYAVAFTENRERRDAISMDRLKRIVSGTPQQAQAITARSIGAEPLRRELLAATHDRVTPNDAIELAALARRDFQAQRTIVEVSDAGVVRFRTHVHISDPAAFQTLIKLLLTDAENRAKIRVCRHCGKLFVVRRQKRTGPSAVTYCSRAHRKAGHDGARQRNQRRALKQLEDQGHDRELSQSAVERASAADPKATARSLFITAQKLLTEKKVRV
jgi:hypothetical protein